MYIILLSYTFILSMIDLLRLSQKIKKSLYYIGILMIFIIFIFNKGNLDTFNYEKIFLIEPVEVEIGYLSLIRIIKFFSGTHQWIIVLIAMLLCYIGFIKKMKDTKGCGLVLFLYSIELILYDINQIRNLLCYILIFQGIEYLKNGKNIKYLLLNTLATTIQKFGFTYFGFYFLVKKKLKLKSFIVCFLCLFMISVFSVNILKLLFIKYLPEKAAYYFSVSVRFGNLIYLLLLILDIYILKLLGFFSKNKFSKKYIEIVYILFPILLFPFSYLTIEIIARSYRNTLLLKWWTISGELEEVDLKKRLYTNILLVLSATLPLISYYLKDKEFVYNLIKVINNI